MTVHLQRYRTEFPVAESSLYLNHVAVCPLPRRVRDAMCGLVEDTHAHRFGVEHWDRRLEAYETARSPAARLLNAEAGEIALVKNTSEAISFACQRIRLAAGRRGCIGGKRIPGELLSLESPGDSTRDLRWREDAKRFEYGTPNTVGIFGWEPHFSSCLRSAWTPSASAP